MVWIDETLYCDGCGVEVIGSPVLVTGRNPLAKQHYCCQDCADGLECDCGARYEQEEDREYGSISSSVGPDQALL